MIHHVSVGTNDLARTRTFYDAVMPILGLTLMKESPSSADYGSGHLVFSAETPVNGQPATPGNGVHIAFDLEDRMRVDRFYEAAMANGGSSDGAPGVRANYDAHYYAAFVFDPDGNKIEAMTFASR